MAISATNFDGTNDYMSRGGDLTGIADGKQGTVSLWTKFAGGDGTDFSIISASNDISSVFEKFGVGRLSSNSLRIKAAGVFSINIAGPWVVSSGWIHILSSWDAATDTMHIYISNVAKTVPTLTNANIDYTSGQFRVGASANGGVQKLNGCLSEVWFDTSYIDLSVESNRRKFISASGGYADLGANGENPTGSSPLVYLPNDYTAFQTNAGTGGNFTVTGALAACTDTPPEPVITTALIHRMRR